MRNSRSTRIVRPDSAPGAGCALERRALRFLMVAPLTRRGKRWRFGTATVGDAVVERLAEQGRVNVTADSATLRRPIWGGA